ncbi:MAG: hypothetical protein LBJ93_02090 [Clostridiales bacterium]|jgi:hypothetical protein|nr:hypothetical protein [Clostridiales bacterium]
MSTREEETTLNIKFEKQNCIINSINNSADNQKIFDFSNTIKKYFSSEPKEIVVSRRKTIS